MSQSDKTAHKRTVFLERARKIVPAFDFTMMRGRHQSIRVNTLQTDELTFSRPIGWAANCYWPEGDKATLSHSREAEEGKIYIQNAASFIPPIVLDPQPKEHILDMCAAPGGKASHIAALTHNQAELWVNDNSRARLGRMITNFERLGVKPHNTTLFAIDNLKHQLPLAHFDKILLDAPCSGEGMLDFDDPQALHHWSVAQIKRLQRVQKKAIATAWDLLRPGGHLIYSTCTMAPEENEGVIDYLLRKQDNARLVPIKLDLPNRMQPLQSWNNKTYQSNLKDCLRLAPTPDIEAFFIAHLQKGS